MQGQFKKGFRQNSKNGLRHVQTIKLGTDKLQLSWDVNTRPEPSNAKEEKVILVKVVKDKYSGSIANKEQK